MSSRRPRRSRIYDLNYNIGENYYKSALDRLDEKYHTARPSSILTRRSEPPQLSPTRAKLNFVGVDGLEDDLEVSRDRASLAIRKETALDHRSGRKALELESDFDGQVQKTLDRIQQSKKLLSSIDNSYDTEAAATSSIVKKRIVKVVSDVSSASAVASNDLTKWSKMSDYNDSETFARVRARQSAARLQDIEQDMQDRAERQFVREQRSANVKKLLADTDLSSSTAALSNGISSMKITKTSQKRITSY